MLASTKTAMMGTDGKYQRHHRRPFGNRCGIVALTSLAGFVCTRTTNAQIQSPMPNFVSARLELTLPNNCGTPALFVDRIRVRSDRIRFHPQETSLLVRAEIARHDNNVFQAKMTIRQPDGNIATRTIEASNCEQAIDGLALVTAVTLDPTSVTRSSEPPVTPATPVTRPEPIVTVPLKATSPPPTPIQPRPQESPYWGLTVAGTLLRGPSPKWMAGGEAAVQWTWLRDSVLSPSVRFGISYQYHDDLAATGGVADFSLVAASLDLCPLQVGFGPFELRTCGLITAGRLSTQGRLTLEPETHRRPWMASGAGAEVDLLLGRKLTLPLRTFAVFPVTRDSYQFAPASFYRTPLVTIGVSAGLAIRFR